MDLQKLAQVAERRHEPLIVEDVLHGIIRLNQSAQRLLQACESPNPVCLLCRMHPHDAARMLAMRSHNLKQCNGRTYGNFRFQTAPGVQELIGFTKTAFHGQFTVSYLHDSEVIGRCSDHIYTEIYHEGDS